MYRLIRRGGAVLIAPAARGRPTTLTDQMNQVQASFQPLMARLPAGYQQRVRDADGETGSDGGTNGDS